jgi:catechol 2,3-dioxygenase-like lactoylglutathione lyase family enzyme
MIAGIHHVTAIARDPQRNLGFYAGVLGLRLVKRTVNFDDPGTYHLYYGDELGRPGTILTFFPWGHARPGRPGVGQAVATAFAVPEESFGYWIERFIAHGVRYDSPSRRFGEPVLGFRDPDGLLLELVATAGVTRRPYWTGGPIPSAHAIRGFHSMTLWEQDAERTAAFAAGHLGYTERSREAGTIRLTAAGEESGTLLDVRAAAGMWPGMVGVGSVHHVAFRAADDAEQAGVLESLAAAGHHPTAPLDRRYFRSIYFREPGGVLFEVATDDPGFATDEDPASLGTSLRLPPWLEPRRPEIEAVLPPLMPPPEVFPSF